MSAKALADYLRKVGAIKSKLIYDAFGAVDRKHFVPEEYSMYAYEDTALPIGYGQTISQPSTVAMMLEFLRPKNGHTVLDIGSGSGWTTALLSHIVGVPGKVVGLELLPGLVKLGRHNLGKSKLEQAQIVQARKGAVGLPTLGPYDRILVSASAKEIPSELIDQLKKPGIMVLPVGESGTGELIIRVEKNKYGTIRQKRLPGYLFVFVPLVK